LTDTIVLIIGSAPDAIRAVGWDKAHFNHVVAINNTWQIRDDWDYLIHPEDFPKEKQPNTHQSHQKSSLRMTMCRFKINMVALCMQVAPWRLLQLIGRSAS